MGGIVFLTNMERQYAILVRARKQLAEEKNISLKGQAVLLLMIIPWVESGKKPFWKVILLFFPGWEQGRTPSF